LELPSVVGKLPWFRDVALEPFPFGREIKLGHSGHGDIVVIEKDLDMLREV
jgi:hypothetical protein